MERQSFIIGKAVRFGWDTVKTNIYYFIVIMLITLLPQALMYGLRMCVRHENSFLSLIVIIIGLFVASAIGIAYTQIGLQFTEGHKATFRDLYSALPSLWDYFIGTLLYSLIVMCGLLLLIVPGIIWGLKYYFVGYFIIDKGMKPKEALRMSGQTTKGVKGYLFLFNLVLFIIILLGALAFGVGLLVAIPVSFLAIAYVYRKLLATEA